MKQRHFMPTWIADQVRNDRVLAWQAARQLLAAASSSALHEGEHTGWDLPATLRDPIRERRRCLPHMKHDMVDAPKDAAAPKGEPEALVL